MAKEYDRIRKGWAEYVAGHRFEWWVSLNFKYPVPQDTAEERLREWTRRICKEERLQVGCVAVFNEEGRIHVHALMLGRNRHGKTLLNLSMETWAKEWWRKNCGKKVKWHEGAWIVPVYEICKVSDYFSKNLIVENGDLSDVFIYNKKLLRKCRSVKKLDAPGGEYIAPARVPRPIRQKCEFDEKAVKEKMVAMIEDFSRH